MEKINLLIASEHYLSRLGVKTLVNVIVFDSDIQETHSFEGIQSIICEKCYFDYIILSDTILPCPQGQYLADLRKHSPKCKFMLIGDNITDSLKFDQIVLNSYNSKSILENFQTFFYKKIEVEKPTSSILSDREIEVLKTIALGFSNKIIADKLCISVNTVVTHRKHITNKLGIKSISGLTVYALINNLVQADEVK